MKYLIFILFPILLFAQNKDISVIRGDYTVLPFQFTGDLTNDSLMFVVKADTATASPRLISKDTSFFNITYVAPKSYVNITINTDDTQGWTAGYYVYDVTKDSTTLVTGSFEVIADVSSPVDGVTTPVRITTVALNNGTLEHQFVWWDTTETQWESVTWDSVKQTLADTVNLFYVEMISDAITSTTTSGFTTAPTFAISGDTLIATSTTAELNPMGIPLSNDWDFTVPSASASQIKILFTDLSDSTSILWQNNILDARFITQTGDTYNFDTTSIDNRINLKLDITDTTNIRTFSDLKYLKNADSTAVRTFSDLKYATQTQYNTKTSLYQIFDATVYDTIFINRYTTASVIDSIWFKTDDTTAIQIRFGADGTGTNVFSAADTIITEETISTFNDATIPLENEAYLYFTFLGDTVTSTKWIIYWQDNQ